MAVSVIIRRTYTHQDVAEKLAPLIVRLRSQATAQPGYITGRTFRCMDCPGEYLVISTWHRLEDWQQWLNSDERRAIQDKIDAILGEATEYRLYEPLIGGILPTHQPSTD